MYIFTCNYVKGDWPQCVMCGWVIQMSTFQVLITKCTILIYLKRYCNTCFEVMKWCSHCRVILSALMSSIARYCITITPPWRFAHGSMYSSTENTFPSYVYVNSCTYHGWLDYFTSYHKYPHRSLGVYSWPGV